VQIPSEAKDGGNKQREDNKPSGGVGIRSMPRQLIETSSLAKNGLAGAATAGT
jgi:hypothetical protein